MIIRYVKLFVPELKQRLIRSTLTKPKKAYTLARIDVKQLPIGLVVQILPISWCLAPTCVEW